MPRLAFAGSLTAIEMNGRQIYFSGESPSGRAIGSSFGLQQVQIPGNLAVCSSCHGYDGLGRPESGIEPTNITWKHLTKTFGHIHDNLQHPAFTEKSLKTFIREGIYPGGQSADPGMPRYDMSESDLDALVAYIKKLGSIQDSGISPGQIRVGTVMSVDGVLAEKTAQLEKLIQGYFEQINASGGIFGRELSLVSYHLKNKPDGIARLREWIIAQDLFVLLSPYIPSYEFSFQKVVTQIDVPVIGYYTLYPPIDFKENRKIFTLLPGVYNQFMALQKYLSLLNIEPAPKVGLVYEATVEMERVVGQLENSWANTEWKLVKKINVSEKADSPEKIAEELRKAHVNIVVYAGFDDTGLIRIMDLASRKNWTPVFLTSGSLTGKALMSVPKNLMSRFFIAYPSLNRDRLPRAVSKLREIVDLEEVDVKNIHGLISAYVSTELLVTSLRKSGREIDRRKMISALEKTYKFTTGLMPTLSYSMNRRVGSDGIYIVQPKLLREPGRSPYSVQWFAPSSP